MTKLINNWLAAALLLGVLAFLWDLHRDIVELHRGIADLRKQVMDDVSDIRVNTAKDISELSVRLGRLGGRLPCKRQQP